MKKNSIKKYIQSKKKQINTIPTKPNTPETETPLLKIPNSSETVIFIYFNKNENLLNFSNEKMEHSYLTDFPIEKCSKCSSKLIVEKSYYVIEEQNVKYYCNSCSKYVTGATKLIENVKRNEYNIIKNLEEYKNKNEKNISSKYIDQLNEFIKFLKNLSYIGDLSSENNHFNNQNEIIRNCFENVTFYFDEINKIELNNIYLFLSNILIIGLVANKRDWFVKSFINFYKENVSFNISILRINSLKYLIKLIFNKEITNEEDYMDFYNNFYDSFKCYKFLDENLADKTIIEKDFDFEKCSMIPNLFGVNLDLAKQNLSIVKLEIDNLKNHINEILSNYYYSYNFISSKKIIERKIINTYLYSILKHYYSYFKPIKEDEKIINTIIKELSAIIKYFKSRKDAESLVNKIKFELNNFQTKLLINKDYEKFKYQKNKIKYKKESKSLKELIDNQIIKLEPNDMQLLKEYSIQNLDNESFTTILVDESKNNFIIQPNKLQVIIEFLFFLRDKAIDIIHLLEKDSALYFPLLNKTDISIECENSEKIIKIINENENEKDINYIEKNKQLFKKIRVNKKEEILLKHTFQYLFQEKVKYNYKKEVQYLIDNIIIPNNKINTQLDYIPSKIVQTIDNLLDYKKKIDRFFEKLDNSFKNFPLYSEMLHYFDKNINNHKIQEAIDYYKKYVQGFQEYEKLYNIKKNYLEYNGIEAKEIKESYIKLIKDCEELNKQKEKCLFIKENIDLYLKENNNIDYNMYYEEWKKKNPRFVVEKYELNDLLADLKLLLPLNEKIKLIGRDKFNFSFYLYLCQKSYFLKDCI